MSLQFQKVGSPLPNPRRVFQLLLVFVIALTLCGSALAQSTTDGAIGGTVYDVNGAVVPNAAVVVHNNGTNAEQRIATDASGYYRVRALQPATYTVTVTSKGFAPYRAENVIVQVGSLTDVSPKLGVAGGAEVVSVTAETPEVNTTSPDFAPVVDSVQISNLPINGGRWSDFALLTPTVVNNSAGFGLVSVRGISSLLNNNTLDGADNNQAFFSEERGRTLAGYYSKSGHPGISSQYIELFFRIRARCRRRDQHSDQERQQFLSRRTLLFRSRQ